MSNQKSEIRSSLLKYAANILSRRPYFRHALKTKLILRAQKYDVHRQGGAIQILPIVDSIIDDLAKSGYLDDVYLAEAFVRRQLSKGYGPRLIGLKLNALQLGRDAINQAIETEATPENQISAMKRFAAKYRHLDHRKVITKLYLRGFDTRYINKLFDGTVIDD